MERQVVNHYETIREEADGWRNLNTGRLHNTARNAQIAVERRTPAPKPNQMIIMRIDWEPTTAAGRVVAGVLASPDSE